MDLIQWLTIRKKSLKVQRHRRKEEIGGDGGDPEPGEPESLKSEVPQRCRLKRLKDFEERRTRRRVVTRYGKGGNEASFIDSAFEVRRASEIRIASK